MVARTNISDVFMLRSLAMVWMETVEFFLYATVCDEVTRPSKDHGHGPLEIIVPASFDIVTDATNIDRSFWMRRRGDGSEVFG
jgi:hypothetical protein